jgi:hypothetical protein
VLRANSGLQDETRGRVTLPVIAICKKVVTRLPDIAWKEKNKNKQHRRRDRDLGGDVSEALLGFATSDS